MIINGPNNFEEELATFEQHKKTLLDILGKAHAAGPKSEPFEEDDAWHHLTAVACYYLTRPKPEIEMLSARRDRLHDLAEALGKARCEAHKATQDDVFDDVLRGWYAETKLSPSVIISNAGEPSLRIPIVEVFKVVLKGLATLEAAASRAAGDVRTRAGPRRGTGILPMDVIIRLQAAYQRSTGINSYLGAGPFFVEFVGEFLIAIGQGANTEQDYVFEALKYERKRARQNLAK